RAAAWTREYCEISRSAALYLNFIERIVERQRSPRSLRRRHPKSSQLPNSSQLVNSSQLAFEEPPTIKLNREEALDYITGFFAGNPDATSYLGKHSKRILETIEL